jgi:hypothetical protein
MTRPTDKEFEDRFRPANVVEDDQLEYVLLYNEAERARKSEARLLDALKAVIGDVNQVHGWEAARAAIDEAEP